jgi:stage II sporulation protein GA (sporulation sigma-E factor processing peptidase)
MFAGGFIGSIIILLSITPLNSISGHPITKMFFSIVMVLTTFGYKRFRYFVSSLMTLYLTTFLVGGILIGTHYFVQFDFQLSTSVILASVKGFGDPISWLFVVLGFPVAWYFSKRNVDSIEMTKIQYDQLIKVVVTINGTVFTFKGLIDSGNQLYDPITKVPVMFVSLKTKMEEVPDTLLKMATHSEDIILGTEPIDDDWHNRMRIIPYKVVGQDHQLIIALKPDRIMFEKDDESFIVDKGLVSFTLQHLSADDAFECIVHPKMLTTTRKVNGEIKVS